MTRLRPWLVPLAIFAVLVSLVVLGLNMNHVLRIIPAQDERTLYRSSVNIPKITFTENYEICLLVLDDGNLFLYSTHEANRIGLTAPELQDDLKQSGHDISNIILVMHNHWSPGTFSIKDRGFYYALYTFGFTGKYALYHQTTGRVEFMGEKQK